MEIAGITCTTETLKTRNGFAHVATALLPDGITLKSRVSYINRTWESYPFQTALHRLFENVAAAEFGCSVQSLRAKKWADARAYADRLMAECDRKHRA